MVRGRSGSPKVGLFQSGSHRIADIPRCPIHHPQINRAADALRRSMRESGAEPYVDASGRGAVRAVQVVVERASQELQIVVVTSDADPEPAQPLLASLRRRLAENLHSLWWNGNPERTNVILGPHWSRLHGEEAVRERIGGADVFFPPAAFGQANLDLADRLVGDVHGRIEPGMRVLELHAGCGAFGLGLAVRGHEVVFNERSPAALRGLELGVAALPDAARAKVRTLPGSAARHASALTGCDAAIVDPPRKGLEPELVEALRQRPPRRLLYVSCDRDSLRRDAGRLRDAGALQLRALVPYALFPFTHHVETLAVFERS
jgi:23S rRNA (uracil1939-C5)-methyltransferase